MLNRPVHRPLPLVEHIDPRHYQGLPIPVSGEQCLHLIKHLKAEVTDIGLQITSGKGNRTEEDYRAWRSSANRAIRARKNQIRILQEWYRQYIELRQKEQEKSCEVKVLLTTPEVYAVLELIQEAMVDGRVTDQDHPAFSVFVKLQEAELDI